MSRIAILLCCLLMQTACAQTITHKVVFDPEQIDQLSVSMSSQTERIMEHLTEQLKNVEIKPIFIHQQGRDENVLRIIDVGANVFSGIGHFFGGLRKQH